MYFKQTSLQCNNNNQLNSRPLVIVFCVLETMEVQHLEVKCLDACAII